MGEGSLRLHTPVSDVAPLGDKSKDPIDLGRVTSIQKDKKDVDIAKKGMQVAIKIEAKQSDRSYLYGRHFNALDTVYSKISRESIDCIKENFRDAITKDDVQLLG